MKPCRSCGETKAIHAFNRNPLGKLGRHSQCRSCQNQKSKDRYHADLATNRKIKAEASSRRRAAHRASGGISRDYQRWAALSSDQYDRVQSILERASDHRAQRICLGILNSGKDTWIRFRSSFNGDELLAQYSGI